MLARAINENIILLPFHARSRNSRLPGRAGRLIVAALRAAGKARRRRAVLNELSPLSERELADIGLTRGDLPRVAVSENPARAAADRLGGPWPS